MGIVISLSIFTSRRLFMITVALISFSFTTIVVNKFDIVVKEYIS